MFVASSIKKLQHPDHRQHSYYRTCVAVARLMSTLTYRPLKLFYSEQLFLGLYADPGRLFFYTA